MQKVWLILKAILQQNSFVIWLYVWIHQILLESIQWVKTWECKILFSPFSWRQRSIRQGSILKWGLQIFRYHRVVVLEGISWGGPSIELPWCPEMPVPWKVILQIVVDFPVRLETFVTYTSCVGVGQKKNISAVFDALMLLSVM